MQLQFKNVTDDHISDCFKTAYARFSELHENLMRLEQLPLKGYTMRAQPIINSRFFSTKSREYRVQLSDHLKISQYIRPAELPRDVLIGWFAHELGHVVDYHKRSALSMLKFILGYVLFSTHRAGAERRADVFALNNGFGDELMATKLYILEKSDLPDKYKDRIKKYYLSPDELELLITGEEPDRVHF